VTDIRSNNVYHAMRRSLFGWYFMKSILISLSFSHGLDDEAPKAISIKYCSNVTIFLNIQLYPARIHGQNSRALRDYCDSTNVLKKLLLQLVSRSISRLLSICENTKTNSRWHVSKKKKERILPIYIVHVLQIIP